MEFSLTVTALLIHWHFSGREKKTSLFVKSPWEEKWLKSKPGLSEAQTNVQWAASLWEERGVECPGVGTRLQDSAADPLRNALIFVLSIKSVEDNGKTRKEQGLCEWPLINVCYTSQWWINPTSVHDREKEINDTSLFNQTSDGRRDQNFTFPLYIPAVFKHFIKHCKVTLWLCSEQLISLTQLFIFLTYLCFKRSQQHHYIISWIISTFIPQCCWEGVD